jgi:hypothetical protein
MVNYDMLSLASSESIRSVSIAASEQQIPHTETQKSDNYIIRIYGNRISG